MYSRRGARYAIRMDEKQVINDEPIEYPEFEDWLYEIENYGSRYERFLDELETMSAARAIEWLRACWKCARNEHKY